MIIKVVFSKILLNFSINVFHLTTIYQINTEVRINRDTISGETPLKNIP